MPARPLLRTACLLALALASGSAAALGLGQIQVKSGPGEPLVAEIPIISSDPAELQQLRAGLASPETFTRIGLEPPVGLVADLRFTTSADAAGRPVIRVTSSQPVTDPLVTFLVEVDWGQGRLVREYSALVAAPNSVAAQPVAPVEMPRVEAPPIVRRPQSAVPAPVAATPRPQNVVPTPTPVQTPARPTPAPVATTTPDEVRVRPGDTLSRIAGRVAPEDVTAEQAMVGLLRANPQAFVGGDMNQLRSGSLLRVPAASELEAVEAREAASLVRGFARQWRQARSQPQAVAPQATAATSPTRAAAAPAPAPAAGGRLDIVPPGAGKARSAATQSGIAAAGEGDMLRQELQQTQETLAARDAELQELKSRVAELERLQSDQQKLIAIKDAELNAAQQRTGQVAATAAAERPADSGASVLPWIGGGALVLLGLLAAAWNRRRAASPAFRAPQERRPSVADAFAPTSVAPSPGPSASGQAVADAAPVAPAVEPEPVSAVPSWERGASGSRRPARGTASASVQASAMDSADALAPQVDPANAERLELAQAYLDLGDTERARQVLAEVEDSDDATARGVASRMRQALG